MRYLDCTDEDTTSCEIHKSRHKALCSDGDISNTIVQFTCIWISRNSRQRTDATNVKQDRRRIPRCPHPGIILSTWLNLRRHPALVNNLTFSQTGPRPPLHFPRTLSSRLSQHRLSLRPDRLERSTACFETKLRLDASQRNYDHNSLWPQIATSKFRPHFQQLITTCITSLPGWLYSHTPLFHFISNLSCYPHFEHVL